MSSHTRKVRRVRKELDKSRLEAEILRGAVSPEREMKREDWAALKSRLRKPHK